jgi:LysM repeat protein
MRRFPALLILLACVSMLSGCGPRSSPTPAANAGSSKPLALEMPVILKTADAALASTGGQVGVGTNRPPASYTVQSGDILSSIAQRFGITAADLVQANHLANPDALTVGQRLTIPGGVAGNEITATPPAVANAPVENAGSTEPVAPAEQLASDGTRPSVFDRLSFAAQMAPEDSPYHNLTWVTFYGRPNVPLLGILGEYSIDELVPRLRKQADAYDQANGPQIGVMPAFHLIYGMAMTYSDDGTYLSYLTDDITKAYIDRARQEKFGVILDVQIGALTPLASIQPAFHWLKDGNVQLAIDPEFAMSTPGQTVPGQPAGAVTAAQINAVQAAMSTYMEENGIVGHRILIVHQFLPWMITDKADIYRYKGVDLTVCADGFGDPPTKVGKYNGFIHANVPFAGYKLFYGWDEPLMTERQALGVDLNPGTDYIEETPNLIIYQ